MRRHLNSIFRPLPKKLANDILLTVLQSNLHSFPPKFIFSLAEINLKTDIVDLQLQLGISSCW